MEPPDHAPAVASSRWRRRVSLSDSLTQDLVELIWEEGLKPGERLPSVQSLAELFEVGAPTLREALRRFQSTGVVNIRHGSGVYVSSHPDRSILANPHRRKAQPAVILQLLQTRQLLEPAAASLAAEATRASGDPGRLTSPVKRLLEKAEQMLDNGDALTKVNMRFHAAIAHMSGNSILADTIDALVATYLDEQHEILDLYDDSQRDYEGHCSVFKLIEAGRSEEAEKEMREHITRVVEIVSVRFAAPSQPDPRDL